jgi:hypothetical protein
MTQEERELIEIGRLVKQAMEKTKTLVITHDGPNWEVGEPWNEITEWESLSINDSLAGTLHEFVKGQ